MIDPAFLGSSHRPPPPPSGDWGDGVAFGARPTQATRISLSNVNGVTIQNLDFNSGQNYSSPFIYKPGNPSNSHVCILLNNCTNITIRNCDFHNVSQPVAIFDGSNITVEWCRLDGLPGPSSRLGQQTGNFLQTVNAPDYVTVRDNKLRVSTAWDPWNGAYTLLSEDVISFFSSAYGRAERNWIDATGYQSGSGTGIILGDAFGRNGTILNNRLLNPGQVGIAVAGDPNHVIDGNWIYKDGDQYPGSGNTAAYNWDYNAGTPTDNVLFQNNRARWINGGGFWNPGPPPATEINNNWNDGTLLRSDVEFTL